MKRILTTLTLLAIVSTCLNAENPIAIKNKNEQRMYAQIHGDSNAFDLSCLIAIPYQNERFVTIQNDSVPTGWKTFTSKKNDFSFQYPMSWEPQGSETEVINAKGMVTAVTLTLYDVQTNSTLLIIYHLAPTGLDHYQYSISQYDASKGWYAKSKSETKVAESRAIETSSIISINGRGETLNLPLRLIIIDFLDKRQTGEIELQLKTPLKNENKQIANLKQLMSTFKFL